MDHAAYLADPPTHTHTLLLRLQPDADIGDGAGRVHDTHLFGVADLVIQLQQLLHVHWHSTGIARDWHGLGHAYGSMWYWWSNSDIDSNVMSCHATLMQQNLL